MAACPITLKDLLTGEDALGNFFLYSAPVGYDNTLLVSSGGPFSSFPIIPFTVDPAEGLIPGGHNAIVDLANEAPGAYVFWYVTPGTFEEEPTDPSSCGVCTDCQAITINKIEPEENQEFEFCTQDVDPYNIFDLAGVSGSDYNIEYAPGSDEDIDFNLVFGSNGYGGFVPIEISTGTYVFILTRVGDSDCESCSFQVTIEIYDPEPAGEDAEVIMCVEDTCPVDLWALVGAPKTEGGNWFYTSGPVSYEIDYGTCPTAPTPLVVNPGDQVGTGHNICVGFHDNTEQIVFTYVTPGSAGLEDCGFDCIDCATITFDFVVPGSEGVLEVCTSDDQINLFDLLTGDPYTVGNWAKISGSGGWVNGKSNDNDGTNDYFIPNDFPAGVHVFRYTIDTYCDQCSMTVTVTILPTVDPGLGASITTCA